LILEFLSAITKTSLGHAGISIATLEETISFAVVTKLFQGQNILSTLGISSVPYAIENIA